MRKGVDWWLIVTIVVFRTDSGLSHRHIYEAVSLYFHRRGRQHLSFIPAIQVRVWAGAYYERLVWVYVHCGDFFAE
jgi:hypothetical protein